MKNLYLLSAILLILSSCAFHNGTITNNVTNEPVVYKDKAVGIASTNVVFGIGGLSKDALISEARKNMVRARPLEGAEQYNNVDVNVKNTFYIIGVKTKVTVNADVIQAKDSIDQETYSEKYLKKIANPQPSTNLFAVGDSIILYNYDYQAGQIIRFVGKDLDRAEISYSDSKKVIRTKEVSINRLYVVKPEYKGLTRFQRTEDGVVIGFGVKKALIKMAGGFYSTIKYPK